MGPNVLALAPRRSLAIEGNPVTRKRMEAAGCEVLTYRGRELSLKAEGGATCLTRPIYRSD
jgi:arginine deiminase